ncbi:dihydroorotase [Coniosporium apollinis]|uniref:Dihydroorotase n=1 Tax=Coniosporium apollinis TaxID=61459 RepID=A0ABQ9NZZ8_9PEZI|nr:dihydroorotase [Coniosporium apollinis]
MERQDLILNLHGELPSVPIDTAEQSFLPTLLSLHHRFPALRIILEHCTSAAAIEAVKSCGPTVAATITAHHLYLTKADWAGKDEQAGDPFCFCKPVAKTPEDRLALLRTAASGNPKFFLGTDSAPHPVQKKREEPPAAGVFTQPYATQLVLDAFELGCEEGVLREEDVTREVLEGFLGGFGRTFYRVEDERRERITIGKQDERIMQVLKDTEGATEVVPFRRGERTWSVTWK